MKQLQKQWVVSFTRISLALLLVLAHTSLMPRTCEASTLTIPFTFVANTPAQAAQVNSNFTAVATVVNGQLDNTNIAANAGILLSKINLNNQAISTQAAGSSSWGQNVTGDSQARVTEITDASGNGAIGWGPGSSATDTILWRSGSNALTLSNLAETTNGTLTLANLTATAQTSPFFVKSATATQNLSSGNTGDTQPRATITSDGNLDFGPGTTSVVDVRLNRPSAGVLQCITPAGVMAGFGSANPVNGCRIYLFTGNPFTDNGGFSTLYFGPAYSNICTFWNGTTGVPQVVSETSYSGSGLTAGTVYDVYVKSTSSTTCAIQAPVAWTNATTPPTRGVDGLGRPTKNGDTTALWVGVVVPSSGGVFNDSYYANAISQQCNRGVSNAYNAVPKTFCYQDVAVATYTYAAATWRAAHGDTYSVGTSFLPFVSARPQSVTFIYSTLVTTGASVGSLIGVNLDSASIDPTAYNAIGALGPSSTGSITNAGLFNAGDFNPGLHTLVPMEKQTAAVSSTYYLQYGSEQIQQLTATALF